jgi:hypothetical protein
MQAKDSVEVKTDECDSPTSPGSLAMSKRKSLKMAKVKTG